MKKSLAIILLPALFAAHAALAHKSTEDATGPQSATAKGKESVRAFDDARFVYAYSGHRLIELREDYEKVLELAIDKNVPIWDAIEPFELPNRFSPEKEALLLNKMTESLGDTYALYFFDKQKTVLAPLTGLTPFYEAAGGFTAIWGIVGEASEHEEKTDLRPTGIALPATSIRKTNNLEASPLESEKQAERIRIEISNIDHQIDIDRIEIQKIRLNRRAHTFFLTKLIGKDTREHLNLLTETRGRLELIQWQHSWGDESWNYNFLLFENPLGENDVAPYDSEYHVLPDLDGNGYPEIMILSTVSQLYSIEPTDNGKFILRRVRMSYFGP